MERPGDAYSADVASVSAETSQDIGDARTTMGWQPLTQAGVKWSQSKLGMQGVCVCCGLQSW